MTTNNPTPTQRSETLLACPFCGGKAEETIRNGRGWLGCLSCHIGNTFNPPYGQWERETWNTRAAVAEPRGDDVLRQALLQAAIEVHVGFQHPRKWEDCDLAICNECKRLVGSGSTVAGTMLLLDPNDTERDQAFRESWREQEKARPFDPAHPEDYATFTKRYAPPAASSSPTPAESARKASVEQVSAARRTAERIVKRAGEHKRTKALIDDITTAIVGANAVTSEREQLGYDPVAHAENMQWLKEHEAERAPRLSDPTAAITPATAPPESTRVAGERERAMEMLVNIEQRQALSPDTTDAQVVIAEWERDFLCSTIRLMWGW